MEFKAGQPSKEAPAPRKHRKLNRSSHQLKRNAACIPCRRRRIKCDAAKPHCGSCVRSFQFLQRTNPDEERDRRGVTCFHENEDEDGEGSDIGQAQSHGMPEFMGQRIEDPRNTVRKLEARVEELQKAMGGGQEGYAPQQYNQLPPINHMPIHQAIPIAPQAIGMPGGSWNSINYAPTPALSIQDYLNHPTIPENQVPITATSIPRVDILPEPIPASGYVMPGEGMDGEAGKLGGVLMDLIWPGWPPRLPTPSIVDHLVQVFFNMVPSISRLIHRSTFEERLRLPPTHPNFPHTSLLHAICAVSARYSAAVHTISTDEWVKRVDGRLGAKGAPVPGTWGIEESIAMEECFGERNAKYAQLEAQLEGTVGRKLMDIVQGMALICYYHQQHADWINGWMGIATAVRAAIPLGLMKNAPGPTIMKIMKPGSSLLPPPLGDWDREERRVLMFTVLLFDINASSSSGWPNMMMTDELYTKLPCSRADWELSGEMTENPQTARSHDLYTNHPIEDSGVALIKGGILLNKVNKFVRYVKAAEPHERPYLKESSEFIQLDEDIKAFIQHFPAGLRDPLKHFTGMHKGIDADLISAHLLPHVAAIFLHEPFADLKDPTCTSAIRLSTESRACLGIIHLVTSTSLDLSYTLVPITSFHLFTAARVLVQFYQRALEINDLASAKVLLAELEILKLAFKALGNRFAMGARHGGMLQAMLDRITVEFGGKVPLQTIEPAVPPEPNMHPFTHPDQTFTSRLQDPNSEPFQMSNDRRRGFVPKSASIHSVSPSNPSPPIPRSGHQTPDLLNPVSGTGSGSGHTTSQNSLFTSSPLQNHVNVDYSVPTQGYMPTNTNFNFNSNSDRTQASNPWENSAPLQPQPPPPTISPAVDFLQPDMGFDWMNWMSTANVSMGPIEEQYGINS